MTDDERLRELLRAALHAGVDRDPSRDLWPRVLHRIEAPVRWSLLDISLAAVVAIALLMFPDWLLLLAYHL
jgi:hypothetical protein